MSARSKLRAREARKNEKRKVKMAKRMEWESKVAAGKNEKLLRGGVYDPNHVRPRTHPQGNCGNVGCKRCFGEVRGAIVALN